MAEADIIPIFPLGMVAFAGEPIHLHIFEERYKQLIQDCSTDGLQFGIVPYFDGRMADHGTLVELTEIHKKYSDGRMDIKTRGLVPFWLEEVFEHYPDKPYGGGRISRRSWDDTSDMLLAVSITTRLKELYTLLQVDNVKVLPPETFRTSQVAHKVGFSQEQELEFSKLATEENRLVFMLDHLTFFIPMVKEMEALRHKAEMNGHFKNITPPQI